MSNINLANIEKQKTEFKFLSSGLFTVAVIFVFLLAVYGWIMWSVSQTMAQKEAIESEYKIEVDKLTSEDNRNIVDFQRRIIVAKDLVKQENIGYDSLPNIEKVIVAGVYLKSIDYDNSKKIISVEGVADDYSVFAKQILSFKESKYFTEVRTGDSNINDKGKIVFTLNIKIK